MLTLSARTGKEYRTSSQAGSLEDVSRSPGRNVVSLSIDSIKVMMIHRESEEKMPEGRKLVSNFVCSGKRWNFCFFIFDTFLSSSKCFKSSIEVIRTKLVTQVLGSAFSCQHVELPRFQKETLDRKRWIRRNCYNIHRTHYKPSHIAFILQPQAKPLSPRSLVYSLIQSHVS